MTSPDLWHSRLAALIGANNVWCDEPHTQQYAIAPHTPGMVVQPETSAQVAAVLAWAAGERLAVVPWGRGTQMSLGQAPRRYDVALSLAGLTRIVEYDDANLTLIAEAGVPLCDVYRLTVPQRQFLPLGFPGTTATLGGLVVTNTSGVKRLRYGSVRDLLLGVRVALPEGELVRFGGRVMKNVAGYDMSKLFIGSLGVFGVLVEATYRLVAWPEIDQGLAVVFPDLSKALAAVTTLRNAALLPSAMLLLHTEAAAAWATALPLLVRAPQVVLVLNYDGTPAAVIRQLQESRALCATCGSMEATELSAEELFTLWEMQEAWRAVTPSQQILHFQIGVPPAALGAVLTQLSATPAFCSQDMRWVADIGAGQLWVQAPLATEALEQFGTAMHNWILDFRADVRDLQGYMMMVGASSILPHPFDVWGEAPGAMMLQRYKQRFDPQEILNPGRYVADI